MAATSKGRLRFTFQALQFKYISERLETIEFSSLENLLNHKSQNARSEKKGKNIDWKMLYSNEICSILISKQKMPNKLLNIFYCCYFNTQNQAGKG